MSDRVDKQAPAGDDAVEAVLGRATPRPLPPADAAASARAALRAEWEQMTRARGRRRFALTGLAASAVLGVVLAAAYLLVPPSPPVQVATLEKSIGTVYLLGEQATLNPLDRLSAVKAGQTIVTAADAAVGLRRPGAGSLRLDADTELRFTDTNTVELVKGRVYYDSAGGSLPLTIVTPLGEVRHVGTQFIAAIDDDRLIVSVREGEVAVEGRFHDASAGRGERLVLAGSRRPGIERIPVFGPEWEWIEATAPATAFRGSSLREFLAWISRETGLAVEFENDALRSLVDRETVRGDISDTPRIALRQSLAIVDLSYEIEDGVIRIRQAGNH